MKLTVLVRQKGAQDQTADLASEKEKGAVDRFFALFSKWGGSPVFNSSINCFVANGLRRMAGVRKTFR